MNNLLEINKKILDTKGYQEILKMNVEAMCSFSESSFSDIDFIFRSRFLCSGASEAALNISKICGQIERSIKTLIPSACISVDGYISGNYRTGIGEKNESILSELNHYVFAVKSYSEIINLNIGPAWSMFEKDFSNIDDLHRLKILCKGAMEASLKLYERCGQIEGILNNRLADLTGQNVESEREE